jgi:hypothetical protein
MDSDFGRFQPQEDSKQYKKFNVHNPLEEESDSEGSQKKFKVFENSEDELEDFEDEGMLTNNFEFFRLGS